MAPAPAIVNCRFAFKCNMTWRDLSVIEDVQSVRYCSQCETAVHLCMDERQLEAHAAKGHCVAYVSPSPVGAKRSPLDMRYTTVGVPISPDHGSTEDDSDS